MCGLFLGTGFHVLQTNTIEVCGISSRGCSSEQVRTTVSTDTDMSYACAAAGAGAFTRRPYPRLASYFLSFHSLFHSKILSEMCSTFSLILLCLTSLCWAKETASVCDKFGRLRRTRYSFPWGQVLPVNVVNQIKLTIEPGSSRYLNCVKEGIFYDGQGIEVQCMGRKCMNSDECCARTACVDPNGVGGNSHLEGVCVPLFPASGGELCDGDNCLIGREVDGAASKLKQFNEECVTSSECDTSRGLCCQFMRSYRTASRQVCSYFVDPKRCVGSPDQRVTEAMLSPKLGSFFKALMG